MPDIRKAGVALRGRALAAARSVLPHGGSLPPEEWRRRHRALVAFLWVNTAVLPIFGLIQGYGSALHDVGHTAALLPFALAAGSDRFSPKLRSVFLSLGLLSAAALLVHLTGGLIEAHFYFFVLVMLLTIYEDWVTFLVAVGYVLIHHGVMGTLEPREVYNRPEAWANPWLWASIHAAFIAMAGAAGVIAWRLNENVRSRMRAAQRELATISETDSLTSLPNRRKAMADLSARFDEANPEGVLILLDLDGFKAYNDTFGHPAGDTLLRRLGQRLAGAVESFGTAYRLGGDEFCVLGSGGNAQRARLEAIAAGALADQGEAFAITASHGSVLIPTEVRSPEEAMQMADQRMYARKESSRPSALSQSKDVLLRALTERHPELGFHLSHVAELVEAVALELGMPSDEVLLLRHAAELHDIGKVAIPDSIMTKAGPLDDAEWQFIHRHTVIGQRIVEAAPVLGSAGGLVRSSHERWDGDGYPDRLAGEQIPLGARIIFVCDAYDAITRGRPHQQALSPEDALAEIRRCAGSQFDPSVVTAFEAVMAHPRDLPALPDALTIAAIRAPQPG